MANRPKKEFLKAGVTSGLATAVDVLCLIAFVEAFRIHVTAAAFWAAVLGGITNFSLNKVWTFRDPSPLRIGQIALYAAVSVANACGVAAIVHIFAVMHDLPYLYAKAAAAFFMFVCWSYPAQALIVFRRPKHQPSPE